jgi:signal transduction histidine kinase
MKRDPYILVVEDSNTTRQLISKYLSDENYKLIFADTGKQALSKARANKFDLILMDINLPDTNGIEVCRTLKNNPQTSGVPVIFVTAFGNGENLAKGFEAGGNDFIHKPFSKKEIQIRIKTQLKLKQAIDDLVIAKEEAQQSEKLKMAFLSNMSHEIRTPMNSIIGFAELLTDDELTEEEKEEFTSIIINSGQQLLNIIDEILTVSKQEAGDFKLINQQFDLNKLLVEIKTAHAKLIQNKAVELYLTLPKGINPIIEGDRVRIKQIFDNLLSNANKFTNRGIIEFGYQLNEKEPKQIEFYVRDSGIGIPENKQALIFERFAQVEDFMTRNYKGTGLGLSIVKNLVELMGGKIHLESKVGEGSIFRFEIPYRPAKEKIPTASAKKSSFKIESIRTNWHGKTILVVDDFEQIYQFFEEALRKTGIRLIYARDGVEALEQFNQHAEEIDLALIDLQMPRMNGIDLCKAIREEGGKLPLVAQTGLALNIKKEDALQAGFDDIIYKPIKVETLEKTLKKFL